MAQAALAQYFRNEAAQSGSGVLAERFAQGLNLSRSQLSRKFAAAEAIGSLGWCGPRGKSPLWVSAGFRREYHTAQAVKLAIIDAAFEAAVTPM